MVSDEITIYNIIFFNILFYTSLVLFGIMYISKKIMKYEDKKKQKQLEILHLLHSKETKIGCGHFICGSKKCKNCDLYYDCRNEFFGFS